MMEGAGMLHIVHVSGNFTQQRIVPLPHGLSISHWTLLKTKLGVVLMYNDLTYNGLLKIRMNQFCKLRSDFTLFCLFGMLPTAVHHSRKPRYLWQQYLRYELPMYHT